LLIAHQRQMGVEQVVCLAAASSRHKAAHVYEHFGEGVACHCAVDAPCQLERKEYPALPDKMESRRIPCFSRARTAVILSSPGQSSCLSITKVGQVAAMRSIVDTGMKSPLACGKSCNAKGAGPIVSTQFSKYVTIASSPFSPPGGAIITPAAPRSITAFV